MAEGVAVAFVLYLLRVQGLRLNVIGLGRRPQKSDFYKAVLGFFCFFIFLIIISQILVQFYPDLNKGKQDVGFNNLHNNLDIFIAFAALVILPPIGEEILVRGYLFSGLRQRLRFLPAMIITSLIFGAAHLQTGSGPGVLWAAGLNTFVLSVVLVYLRQSTGALYAGMLVHMVNNLIAFGVYFR
jgi:membrane protease YdiL (CAAX protease family)